MTIIITEDYVKDILKRIGTVRRLGTLGKLNEGDKAYTLMTRESC
jgi:hypothetical protein